jgi:uncharacterized protein (DUF1800 family)
LAGDPKIQAALALHRFGFGPRADANPGSIAAIASDPRGALIAELDKKGAGLTTPAPDLMRSAQSSRAVADFNAERQAQDRLERRRREAEQAHAHAAANAPGAVQIKSEMAPPPAPNPASPKPVVANPASAKPATPPPPPPLPQRLFLAETKARFDAAYAADLGFVERLVTSACTSRVR